MNTFLRRFFIATGLCFSALFALSFTQLTVLPFLFKMMLVEPKAAWFFFAIFGLPFGGVLALLLFTPNSKFLDPLADLCGFWIGGLLGSLVGLHIAGPQFEDVVIEGVDLRLNAPAQAVSEAPQ